MKGYYVIQDAPTGRQVWYAETSRIAGRLASHARTEDPFSPVIIIGAGLLDQAKNGPASLKGGDSPAAMGDQTQGGV